ncbi:MAG TPA: APC family permease [Acidimicrobiales bacterium]|nr:APC family permease [Acidimicrobiales bacterium]
MAAVGTSDVEAAPLQVGGGKGLKVGALGLLSTLVIGVASVAPAYSLAASLGLVTSSVGFFSPSVMFLAFIPMLFIAAAYYYMNRADPDCGTTFTWVTRAMGPKSGWIGGWAILVTDLVVMPSLASIAGQYTFSLFGLNGLASSTFWVTVIGVIWIAVMTLICYIGIELSARTQVALLGAELVILVAFAVTALAQVYGGHVKHSVHVSAGWLNPLKLVSGSGAPGWGAVSAGMLTAVFIYWGWDTAVTVNEETKDAKRTPGLAAVLSTLVLLAVYLVVSLAAQAYHGAGFLTNNSGDVLGALANDVFGSAWGKLLIIAVLTSAAASTQTTILPAARSSLSMAVHKAFPKKFGEINAKHLTPGFATILFGAVSIAWYVILTWLSPNAVLGNSISALGFGIAFYYGITGYACVFYYRKHIFRSFKNFVMVGLAPFVGAMILTVMFFIAAFYYSNPANAFVTGQAWLPFIHFHFSIFGWQIYVHKGLGPPVVLGIGLLLLGVPLMLIWRVRHREFFEHKREAAESLEATAPPLTPGVVPVTD